MDTPRRALLLASAVPVLALAGCGTQQLDSDKAEEVITQGIEEQTKAEDVSVECPDDVELKAGGTFECTAKAGEDEAPVKVVQKDDQGNVQWNLAPQPK